MSVNLSKEREDEIRNEFEEKGSIKAMILERLHGIELQFYGDDACWDLIETENLSTEQKNRILRLHDLELDKARTLGYTRISDHSLFYNPITDSIKLIDFECWASSRQI
jgi:hypothetical protein